MTFASLQSDGTSAEEKDAENMLPSGLLMIEAVSINTFIERPSGPDALLASRPDKISNIICSENKISFKISSSLPLYLTLNNGGSVIHFGRKQSECYLVPIL